MSVNKDMSQPTIDELREAVAGADLRVLLMVLAHLTGDHAWLEPPFRPVRDVRLRKTGPPRCQLSPIKVTATMAPGPRPIDHLSGLPIAGMGGASHLRADCNNP